MGALRAAREALRAAGEEAELPRGGPAAVGGGRSRKLRVILIGQGPMPQGEIQEKPRRMVASGLPR